MCSVVLDAAVRAGAVMPPAQAVLWHPLLTSNVTGVRGYPQMCVRMCCRRSNSIRYCTVGEVAAEV